MSSGSTRLVQCTGLASASRSRRETLLIGLLNAVRSVSASRARRVEGRLERIRAFASEICAGPGAGTAGALRYGVSYTRTQDTIAMRTLVGYATHDGHTRVIAAKIGEVLAAKGHSVDVVDLDDLPRDFSLDRYEVVVLGAPVRKGKHLRTLVDFARKQRASLQRRPSALFSSSLTSAEQSEEAQRTARELVDGFIADTGWRPDHIGLFAGALLYRKYNFIVRALMKAISRKAGGDTDTTRDYDYTRWDEVDAFANEIAQTLSARVATGGDAPSPGSRTA